MRVLQVSHLFLPESAGGTEVHTHLLAKALQRAGHEVAVCAHIQDKTRPEHELIQGEFDGLPVYRLVNNFTWSQASDFEFFDPGQDAKFEAILDACPTRCGAFSSTWAGGYPPRSQRWRGGGESPRC
jgi:hypothetical protein